MSQAIATNSIVVNITLSLSPAIASVVMLSGEVAHVFLVNGASYLVMAFTICLLRRKWSRDISFLA